MSRVSVKAKTGSGKGMREMQRIRVGMRWMGWGISVGMRPIWVQMQNVGNQGGDAGNQGGN